MRTSIRRSQQLLQTSSPSRRNLSTTRSQELPAPRPICQACNRPLLSTSFKARSQTARRFNSSSSASTATSQPSPQSDASTSSTIPIPKTHYDLFPETLSQGPPPSGPFAINLPALRKEFLQLQQKSHPDLFPPHQKIRAEGLSSLINTAYKTLQSPLLRAQYLLSLQGIETVEDETAKVEDRELLMDVMEAREIVENAEEEGELEGVRAVNEERIKEAESRVGECLERADWEAARGEVVRLRYWVNVRESIHGWEKGKGGGVNHH